MSNNALLALRSLRSLCSSLVIDASRVCILIATEDEVISSRLFLLSFQWKPQSIVFGIVTNKKFDMIIMGFIFVNMLTMTLDHYDQNKMWSFALDNLNLGFIVIFSTECILKIFALRQYYFKEPWNMFDFVVVILSVLGKPMWKFVTADK